MTKLTVQTGQPYDIYIGDGLIDCAGQMVQSCGKRRAAVISDEHVWQLHGAALSAVLQTAEVEFYPLVLPAGEQSKSLSTLAEVYQYFAQIPLLRDDIVIAFGGGVMGDLAGFAAATYMRGMDVIQIPTTLLAQVDSAVGGKTAVNLPSGKNMVGAFHQPKLVICDPGLLATLPGREYSGGMAEVIKYAMLFSKDFLRDLENTAQNGRISPEATVAAIAACCGWKKQTVEEDTFDRGRRMILNLGHTFGHAIEKLGDYAKFSHGEAVAMGMKLAVDAGMKLGVTPAEVSGQLAKLLSLYGLNNNCPYQMDEILPWMQNDKKAGQDGISLILLSDIGRPIIYTAAYAELEAALI